MLLHSTFLQVFIAIILLISIITFIATTMDSAKITSPLSITLNYKLSEDDQFSISGTQLLEVITHIGKGQISGSEVKPPFLIHPAIIFKKYISL